MAKYPFVAAPQLPEFSVQERIEKSQSVYDSLKTRRTIRDFAPTAYPKEVIENCILAAGTAPNGANLQPWHFCVVNDRKIKQQIREEAEIEEREFYNGRAPQSWLDALAALGTDEHKPFLEDAPSLIVIFAEAHKINDDGEREKNYYVSESVGIATGFLINALHECGLATLTHTPSPMKFLNKILGRPDNERPFLILVTGLPAKDAKVPDITKRPLSDVASFF